MLDTDLLYDGVCYGVYLPSDGKTFAMGSGTYNDGFVIYDDHSLFGSHFLIYPILYTLPLLPAHKTFFCPQHQNMLTTALQK